MLEITEDDFAQTKLDEVATRAGIATGTIYRYFKTKEARFEAAVKSDAGTIISPVKAVIPWIYREPRSSDLHILTKIMIGESVRFPAIVQCYYRESVLRGQKILARVIRRGIERREFLKGALAASNDHSGAGDLGGSQEN